MKSKYLFRIEKLYMKINLGCHYICSLVPRQILRAGVTFLQPLLRIYANNRHTNFVARYRGCRKTLWNSLLMSAGPAVGPAIAGLQW